MLEQALRQSLLISQGDFMIFINRPISGITLGITFLLLVSAIFPHIKKSRQEYGKFKEQ